MKKMKKKLAAFLVVFFALAAWTAAETAAQNRLGLGLAFGESSYLSVKYGRFPVLGIGWSAFNELHVHLDYWIINESFGSQGMAWFLGAGVKTRLFRTKDKDLPFAVGIRIPGGIQWFLRPNAELFAELAPGLSIVPFELWGDGALGIRFYLF